MQICAVLLWKKFCERGQFAPKLIPCLEVELASKVHARIGDIFCSNETIASIFPADDIPILQHHELPIFL
jgi:hypothetical protein